MLMTRFVLPMAPSISVLNDDLWQRKLNVPVTATLLRRGLISITQQDQQLAKFLFADPKPTLQNFATGLIRECITCDPPLASQSQFSFTIEVLSQIMQTGKANDE
jgi:CCR4-NOT transcription complex subunit 1